MAIVDQKTLFEVRLPCIWVSRVEQRTRVRDVRERVIFFFLGNRVRKVSRGVDITIKDIDDAVASLLTS